MANQRLGGKQPNPAKLKPICRARRIDYDDVVAVDFDPTEIVLCVRGMGQVRIKRKLLPASIETLPDTIEEMLPVPNTAVAQPAPGQKRTGRQKRAGKSKRKRV